MNLHHLTLNTGDLAVTSRRAVAADVIDRLMPLIDAEGGPVPDIDGWFIDLLSPLDKGGVVRRGAAFFQIADEPGMSKRPAVMAFACWRKDLEAEAWQQLSGMYRAMRGSLQTLRMWRDLPAQPPAAPWLAVWLTPFLVSANPAAVAAFGDLERCMAWALMDARP